LELLYIIFFYISPIATLSIIHVAALVAIQEAVCLQRYDYHVWLALSRASMTLSSALQQETCIDMITNCKSTYQKKLSVDIVTRTMILLKPHFKFNRDSGRPVNSLSHEPGYGNSSESCSDVVTGVMYIIDQLAAAVDKTSDNQVYITTLSKQNLFCQLLMILSCASCLWARYCIIICHVSYKQCAEILLVTDYVVMYLCLILKEHINLLPKTFSFLSFG